MTDDTTTDDESTTDIDLPGATDGAGTAPGADGGSLSGRSIVEYLQWALFGILVLVLLLSTLQFYNAATSTINTFVAPRYRPPFRMAFNLAMVLVSGLGLSLLVRKLA